MMLCKDKRGQHPSSTDNGATGAEKSREEKRTETSSAEAQLKR